ncbi:MAG: virginiamycin B lyase family protein [Ktedonobacterales bacterium]
MIHSDIDIERESPATRPPTRERQPFWRSEWMRRQGIFLAVLLLIGGLTGVILAGMGAPKSASAPASKPAIHSTGQTANAAPVPTEQASAPLPPGVQPAHIRAWGTVPGNSGVMLPALDQQGNLWFGEMFTNKLARLDPQTGVITTWTAPKGRYNIMDTVVDSQGNVWYSEQAANYIGRFDPTSEQFTLYPLGTSSAPQDLVFDSAGKLWFTEFSSKGKIGRLDPATGAITTWNVPEATPGTTPYPFSLAVLPSGQIWFGDLSGGAIGRLDPTTGAIQNYHLSDPTAGVYAMAPDGQGRVWFTEYQSGKLGYVDTRTDKVTEIAVPQTLGNPAGMYAIVPGADGTIWFTSNGSNAIVAYASATGAFTFYQLPVQQSVPFGMVMDGHGDLWFTAGAQPNNYVGALVR